MYELICSRCGLPGTHSDMEIEQSWHRCRDRRGCFVRWKNGDMAYLRLHVYMREEQAVVNAMKTLDQDLEAL